MARLKTSSDFAAEVACARKVLQGKSRAFFPQELRAHEEVSMTMARNYLFLPASEWSRVFSDQVTPKDMKLEAEVMLNEQGEKVAGFVFSDESPWRNLTVSWRCSSNLETCYLGQDKHIRAGQGKAMEEWSRANVLNETRPRVLRFGAKDSPPTVKETKALIEVAVAKAKESQPEEAKPEMPPPPMPAPQPQELSDEDTDSGSELAPTDMLRVAKIKVLGKSQKGKGKAKQGLQQPSAKKRSSGGESESQQSKQARPSGPRSSDAQSERTHRSRSPLSRSEVSGGDGMSQASQLTSTGDRLLDSVRKYEGILEELLPKVLVGSSVGNDVGNAKKALQMLQARDPGSGDCVDLQAKINLVAVAQKVRVQSVASIARDQRIALVKELFPRLRHVPPAWASSLLVLAVKDLLPDLGSKAVQERWAWFRQELGLQVRKMQTEALRRLPIPLPLEYVEEEHRISSNPSLLPLLQVNSCVEY